MPNTGTITGLSPATDYVLDAVHVDAWGNVSAVESSDAFETDAAPANVDSVFTAFGENTDGNFTAQSFGTAAENRVIYAFVASANGDEPTQCTIAGSPATDVGFRQIEGFASENITVWALSVPTGTSGNVVVSGGSATNFGLAVAAVYGKSIAGEPVTDGTNGGGSVDLSTNVQAGDDILAVALARNGSAWTWTGLTKHDEIDIRSGEWFSAAIATAVTAAAPRTITGAAGGSTAGIALVFR